MTTWTESMDGSASFVDLGRCGNAEQDYDCGFIKFQAGPMAEVGPNGTTIEAIIDVLIARLSGFQAGPFANEYNADALTHLGLALTRLTDRTRDRQARGVEGLNKA